MFNFIKNNIQILCHFFKDEESPKFIISLDWYIGEDPWRQRYMFSTPRYEPKEMQRHKINNENRHRWFVIDLDLNGYSINVRFKLNKVGNVVHGRLIDEEANVKKWKERKEHRSMNG